MKPASFGYVRPETVRDACRVLADQREEARIIAGGQSLGAMLNMRLVRPSVLVDVNRIDALTRIEDAGNTIITGALMRQADALMDARIRSRVPLLAMALPHVGHYQTRNRGTLGGSSRPCRSERGNPAGVDNARWRGPSALPIPHAAHARR